MKKFLKIIGCIALAAVLTAGGYIAGAKNGMKSITSALPHVNITHGLPDASLAPLPAEDEVGKLPPPTEKDEAGEPEKTGRTVVKTNESSAAADWTLIKSYSGSLIKDDTATVSVYTSAQKMDGEIIWDDSQQWVVEVRDNDGGYYVLMDKCINNGSVYFDVTEADGKTSINVFTKTTAGMEIKQYTYGGNGFTETTLYSSGAVNTLCSTLPDYQ